VIDLPQGFVESCFHDDITPGTIFRAFITTTSPPKTKYFVLVARDPLCCFFINSETNEFKASRPHDYDALVMHFSAGHASSTIAGELTKADKKRVYDVVSNSSTLALRLVQAIKQEIRP